MFANKAYREFVSQETGVDTDCIEGQYIRALRPDVLVKGSDYNLQTVVGADEVLAYGGTVHLASLVDGCSTSGLVRRMGGPEKAQGPQGRAESRAG